MEKMQTLLFADAVGWQECFTHGGYDPHAYYQLFDLEQMMVEDGYISCPICDVEIGGDGP